MTTAVSSRAPAALTSFDSALSHEPADKRIEILRLVGESGSISQAGRDAGVSYKAAWQAIDTLTNLAGVTLVERAVGGTGGGGARITDAGRQLLALAQRLADSRRQLIAEASSAGAATDATGPALSHIGLRTSMRNQLPCVVGRLEVKGQIVRVHLRLAGGGVIVSRITRASAELLALTVGQPVLALCKATAIHVQAEASVGAAKAGTGRSAKALGQPGNLLAGRAVRVNRSADGDEVSLQLENGLQLVGFAPAASGLKTRAAVRAGVEESAIVIALAD